jgi:cobyrinic acid a,c-diamide synthase
MAALPRIAVGTVQPQADLTAVVWALMDALATSGLHVQSFLSHAYFAPRDAATAITGLPPRHVDSWLMSEAVCREVFARGSRTSDLAIVEGNFTSDPAAASDFETICRWLDLPRIAVIDARLLSTCRLPARPEGLEGLILDRVADPSELCRLQTLFESLWKVPVIAWLGLAESLRREIDLIPPGRQPELALCHALGDAFRRGASLPTIRMIAAARPLPACANRREARPGGPAKPLRVAVAYDDAFRGYFPDTLDLLEAGGATISDFSPLRDERLPPETDVVYVGCGHPERFAAGLSKNDCMMLALKSHLCGGRRIYAECGGLAYLCHELEMPDGSRWPMVGVLPATARFDPTPARPKPTELRLASDTWLGRAGDCWRGYLSTRFSLHASPALASCAAGAGCHELDVVKRHHAVGSRVYLNFAAQSGLLESFFAPRAAPGREAAGPVV